METTQATGGLDRQVLRSIRYTARRLARRNVVPGMQVEDYEQDFTADLLHRRHRFDPARGSFATFADRVVTHRAITLGRPTAQQRAERAMISLQQPVTDWDGDQATLGDIIPEKAPPTDDAVMFRIDIGRFLSTLPGPLVAACDALLVGSIARGARQAGLHRSTVHERQKRLRQRAAQAGLSIYFEGRADTLATSSVCGDQGDDPCRIAADPSRATAMPTTTRHPRIHLHLTEADLRAWLSSAGPGATLVYHRGALALDRAVGSRLGEAERQELDRVAAAAMALAQAGRVHLLQRRHGDGDYSYLMVVGRSARSEP